MIVARQFIAWNTPKKGEPSRRDGVSWATRHIHRQMVEKRPVDPIIPFPTGRVLVWHTPGNKLPGYDRSVPPGQRHSTPVYEFRRQTNLNQLPVHIFEATSLRVAGFEDESEGPREALRPR
jgi:hypothetical protein